MGKRYTVSRVMQGKAWMKWENYSASELLDVIGRIFPGHEWPENEAAFIEELRGYDRQGLTVEEVEG